MTERSDEAKPLERLDEEKYRLATKRVQRLSFI
jgi:hypothetical protein